MVYERNRGIQYIVENGFSRSDGMGGLIIKPGLIASFKPISDTNQMGVFDTHICAERYVNMEISSGRVESEKRKERVEQIDKRLQDFVENHPDYTREGGLGLIRRQKTREERAVELRQHAAAIIEQAQELEAKAETMTEEELEAATAPKKKDDEMAKPVGVVTGAVTSADARVK